MDDILVHGNDKVEHDKRLHQVLERIKRAGMKLNKSKCHFEKVSVSILRACHQ